MNRKEYDTPKGKAVFDYDGNGVGRITLECMDMLMDMVASSMWIPCSERLPEEDICNSYLIAWIPANEKVKCGLPHYYQVADWEDGDWTNLDFCGHEEIVILAWMPLPEPWEGADDEVR